MNPDISRFESAVQLIDQENSLDPHQETAGGVQYPKELLYSKRLTEWVQQLAPHASTELLLATRAQHIARWTIPRNSYPMTRVGYLKWREELKKFHAEKAGAILKKVGYDETTVERVKQLILKKNFPKDPESRILEDAVNLHFLEFQFTEFSKKTDPQKTIDIVRKTWKKMSADARARAVVLPLGTAEKKLIAQALSS